MPVLVRLWRSERASTGSREVPPWRINRRCPADLLTGLVRPGSRACTGRVIEELDLGAIDGSCEDTIATAQLLQARAAFARAIAAKTRYQSQSLRFRHGEERRIVLDLSPLGKFLSQN
jgi:hypothetical protein